MRIIRFSIHCKVPSVFILFTVMIMLTFASAMLGQIKAISQAYQLTHSINYDPTFSPDGLRMIYVSIVLGKEQLFESNADGSNTLQITHDDADHEDPAWSPDGKTVAFVYIKDRLETISLLNIERSNEQRLTPANQRAIHPSWSPDGSRLAYCTDDDLAPPEKE